MEKETIKILIADDHPLIRQGISKIIMSSSMEDYNIDVVHECSNGKKAILYLKEHEIDIAIIDLNMPEMNGIDFLKFIKKSDINIRTIILTANDNKKTLKECISLGANGYILKFSSYENILNAIYSVYNNKTYIDPGLSEHFFEYTDNDSVYLTNREKEILLLIAKGFSNTDISSKLFISEQTVKNHLSHIYEKLNVKDRANAIIWCYDNKFI